MKLRFYLRNLFRNTKSLLKSLLEDEGIRWADNKNQAINCIIHEKAVVNDNHLLTNVTIDYGTYISWKSLINNTSIGKFCSIGPGFFCGWGIHPIDGISTSPAFYSTKNQVGFTFSKSDKIQEQKSIVIGNDVFIGANVIVLDGITIGDGAVIGAGAVVSKNIPAYAIAVGNPIKILRYRFNEETVHKLLEIRWWDRDIETYKKVEKYFFDVESFITLMERDK